MSLSSICLRCRVRLQLPRSLHTSASLSRRPSSDRPGPASFRSVKFGESEDFNQWMDDTYDRYADKRQKRRVKVREVAAPTTRAAQRMALRDHIQNWGGRLAVQQFLRTLGLTPEQTNSALARFKLRVLEEIKGRDRKVADEWDWDALKVRTDQNVEQGMDRALMSRFLELMPRLDREAYGHLVALREALVLPHPSEWHPMARQVQRKIIMHVGPTNSGKTYHALRALAAAQYGCYAGPLRLLATEIFQRLNSGDIAPAGADPSIKHPRLCNLVTGEEVKILDEDAGLMSCTVEMIPLTKKFDVVVIDEIQMIAHQERGNGWTQALVGLNAEEIHLCGEESAVELVQELIKSTGDEVIINRYERLTPLQLAPTSMLSDLSGVRSGDCVVAFSRNSIFATKAVIEEKTGLRCAVAYGKLPPEVRVEQATKFNIDNNEYPVLVASDAIGMGLNLKIKRIIFTTVKKWNGYTEEIIPLNEIKQIAGRAGRYGLHGPDSVGLVTTLHKNEYNILRDALQTPVPNLLKAVIAADNLVLTKIHRLLPPNTGLGQIYQLLLDLAVCEQPFALIDYFRLLEAAAVVDDTCSNLSISTRALLTQTPVPWKIPEAIEMFRDMLLSFAAGQNIDSEAVFDRAGLMGKLEDVSEARELHLSRMEQKSPEAEQVEDVDPVLSTREAAQRLVALETLHKMTCVYLWLSYRFPVAFNMQDRTNEIKRSCEIGIDFCLQMIQADRASALKKVLDARNERSRRQEHALSRARRSFGDYDPTYRGRSIGIKHRTRTIGRDSDTSESNNATEPQFESSTDGKRRDHPSRL